MPMTITIPASVVFVQIDFLPMFTISTPSARRREHTQTLPPHARARETSLPSASPPGGSQPRRRHVPATSVLAYVIRNVCPDGQHAGQIFRRLTGLKRIGWRDEVDRRVGGVKLFRLCGQWFDVPS
jgi:hypothetical protein